MFINGREILIYHINARVPLRRENDLDGTCITVISGHGVLAQVLQKIKEGKIEAILTIGIEAETVKLIKAAIIKSKLSILLIEYELKGNETREIFLRDLKTRLLWEEDKIATLNKTEEIDLFMDLESKAKFYRLNNPEKSGLSLNLGNVERSKRR